MNARQHPPRPRFLSSLLALFAILLVSVWSSVAHADIPRIPDDGTGDDPAATFDADCLGDTEAEDCEARAALIEGELVMLLSQLDGDGDPATKALFEGALEPFDCSLMLAESHQDERLAIVRCVAGLGKSL